MNHAFSATTADGGTQTARFDHRTDSDSPAVSVVVPVYNDPAGIAATLDSLAVQTRSDFEILVVDNASTDNTAAVARDLCATQSGWRVLTESTPGSYAARNCGIDAARAPILAFLDADETVEMDWLARVVDRMEDAQYLGCAVDLGPTADDASLAARFEHRTAFPIADYVREGGFAPTCCLVVTRTLLDDVGPFDAGLQSSGDREFGNRVRDAGYALDYAADIVVHHPPRTTLGALRTKAVRIGRGSYQLRRRYPERYGSARALLINPLTYTPPTPATMRSSVRGWDGLSLAEKARFTALATLLTVDRARGKLREAVDGVGSEAGRSVRVSRVRGAQRRLRQLWPRLFEK